MARTEVGAALTALHKAAQERVLAGVVRGLIPFWAKVDPDDLGGTLDAWASEAGALTVVGRRTSAGVARQYYSALRRAERITGTFAVPWPDDLPPEALHGATVASAVRGIRDAERRGARPDEAKAKGLTKATGSIITAVADGGRQVVLGAVARDPGAVGYQRVTDGDPCAFCRMLASKGIVRYDPGKAGFQAHAHCGCTAEPAFTGDQISPENAEYRRQWMAATRGESDALNAFRRHLDALEGRV